MSTVFDAFGITLEEAKAKHPMDKYEHLVPAELPWSIYNGDALEVLKTLPDNSYDACYCDPPYGISFMGREWDKGVPSAEVWAEVLRVLKPGAPLLAFGGTRMWHRLAVNIEDAGFEIRDTFMWCFGQGFPKGLDLSKGIAKTLPKDLILRVKGAMKEAFDRSGMTGAEANRACGFTFTDYLKTDPPASDAGGRQTWYMLIPTGDKWDKIEELFDIQGIDDIDMDKVAKVVSSRKQGAASGEVLGSYSQEVKDYHLSEEAERWVGYKTALKPAWEPIVVAIKPLDGTFVNNALEHGVAGYNIDGSRISSLGEHKKPFQPSREGRQVLGRQVGFEPTNADGRYPTNFVLSHTDECICHGTKKVKSQNPSYVPEDDVVKGEGGYSGGWKERPQGVGLGYGDADGNETVEDWECAEHCPVKILDDQSGTLQSGHLASSKRKNDSVSAFGDGLNGFVSQDFEPSSGGASRFYYCAKASTSEREAGLVPEPGKKRANNHPTAKPLDLNRYFTKLILPPARDDDSRKLLIPFSGVGSEMIGAFKGGWDHVTGIELQAEYVDLAHQRLKWWVFGGGADE